MNILTFILARMIFVNLTNSVFEAFWVAMVLEIVVAKNFICDDDHYCGVGDDDVGDDGVDYYCGAGVVGE